MKNEIIIFADGSSIGNPGPGGWGVVLVYGSKVVEFGGGNKNTTNNRMELTAAIEALSFASKLKTKNLKLTIRTDSRYVINGITKWVNGWEKNGWIGKNKKDILNQDLWKKLSKLASGKKIKWGHVHGHAGIPGNERVDFIATLCAKEKQFKTQRFFDGPITKYPFDIFSLKESKKRPVSKRGSSGGKTAYSYLSLVNGVLVSHKTWTECEKRVKGVSGAKFKKALSKEDEEKIKREWGLTNNNFQF
ncbi:MAG: ribonuclease HI [Patescibacteria group bacterium]